MKSKLPSKFFDVLVVVIRHEKVACTFRHQPEKPLVIQLVVGIEPRAGTFPVAGGIRRINKISNIGLGGILPNQFEPVTAIEIDPIAQFLESANTPHEGFWIPPGCDSAPILALYSVNFKSMRHVIGGRMSEAAVKLARLKQLQTEAEAIRNELGISPPGAVIYQAYLNPVDDEVVVVEADGFGGATLKVVEGNYPIDYNTSFERVFEGERDAQEAAGEVLANPA